MSIDRVKDISGRFRPKEYAHFAEFSANCGRDLGLVGSHIDFCKKEERNEILKRMHSLITDMGENFYSINNKVHCYPNGYTALHYFARIGDKETVVLLHNLYLDIRAIFKPDQQDINIGYLEENVLSEAESYKAVEEFSSFMEADKALGGGNYEETVSYIRSEVQKNFLNPEYSPIPRHVPAVGEKVLKVAELRKPSPNREILNVQSKQDYLKLIRLVTKEQDSEALIQKITSLFETYSRRANEGADSNPNESTGNRS